MTNFFDKIKLSLERSPISESAHFSKGRYNRAERNLLLTQAEEVKDAAVLLLLYFRNEQAYFSLMQRPEYNGTHSKEVCFPGGKKEDQDNNDLKQTALRETNEEFGVPKENMSILGPLHPVYISVSNYLITPFVASIDTTPVFVPEPEEVDEIIEIPFEDLFDDKNLHFGQIQVAKGAKMDMPYFTFQNKIVWGATAFILDEFRELCLQSGLTSNK